MIRNKKLKRIIVGGIGFAMAGVMFFVGSMQSMQEVTADVRVFDRITERYPYEGTNTEDTDGVFLNILEIVPDGGDVIYEDGASSYGKVLTINENAEMGYFLPHFPKDQNGYTQYEFKNYYSPTFVTYGTELGAPIYNANTSLSDVKMPAVLQKMRTYGMIKPFGADGANDYPIYAVDNNAPAPVFINYKPDKDAAPLPDALVKGVYALGAGDYNIADGYTIDENGTICKEEHVSVSEDSTLSQNHPYDPVTNTVTILTPVTDDIDNTVMDFPRSKSDSNLEYITPVDDYENNKGKGLGNVTFTRSETQTTKTLYYGYSDLVIYYNKNTNLTFRSSSYFREYVLGSGDKYKQKDIQYDVKIASTVTAADIEKADLVYISGTSARFSASETSDISKDVLLKLYNEEVLNHKAVMMDYACYSADSASNVSKLATLLWRESQSEIVSDYPKAFEKDGPDGETKIKTDELQNVDFMTGDALKDLKDSMMTGANGNFVTGNVYVYNHHMSDFDVPKSLVDAGDIFANGDFNSAYKTSVAQQGFSEVLGYIVTTNKNSTTGQMLASVTPAVAIQYILISDGNPLTLMKNELHVLEIQPTTVFLYNEERGTEEYGYLEENGTVMRNRDSFIKSYLGNYYDDKADYITFTSMTVDEFNGRNDDLIETYDVIYIGSEMGDKYYTSNLNTAALSNDGKYSITGYVSKPLPTYTDSYMNGNVYYNIGDIITTDKDRLMKFLVDDTNEARLGGRDITKDKLAKLKAYLDTKKLMLVEGDLVSQVVSGSTKVNPTAYGSMTDANVDHGRIDNSSNMYELMMYGIGYRFNYKTGAYENASAGKEYSPCQNMISVRDIANNVVKKSTAEQYLATEKLTLTMLKQPTEYSYSLQEGSQVMDPDTVVYMEENADGTRELKYEFIISSDLVAAEGISTYRPHLYVDVNNDGKYSKVAEDVRDMQIVIKASGQEAERDEKNNYVLYKDVEYQMTRELDESYSGYIKWKISIQSNVYENTHASVEGSTVVKNKGDNELIKILQITRPEASTLSLEEQENNKTSLFGKYLDAVPGYDVEIKTIKLTDFSNDFDAKWNAYQQTTADDKEKTLEEYALEYFKQVEIVAPSAADKDDGLYGADMLVLGFGDDFPSIQSDNAVAALKSYMDHDMPVLLAHDFIMYWADKSWYNGATPTPMLHGKYLRNYVGMDKYGVTMNIVEKETDNGTVAELVTATTGKGLNYLRSGTKYTRTDEKDVDKVNLIEKTGKLVAYAPGTTRESTVKNTQGLSNSVMMRWKTGGNGWLNVDSAETDYYGAGDYMVEKMNDGQITSFPYTLPDTYKVNATHGQYFQLDLDADDDSDGEGDVVVWYALGDALSLKEPNDKQKVYNPWCNEAGGPIPADSYYIYNKGNVTYTGAGHGDMTNATETEAQLFINTLFAAYNAATTTSSVGFFENIPRANDEPINSITVPYDENVTEDSSVLKDATGQYRYHFVNPNSDATTTPLGTPAYFRLSDTNFVRGKKYMEIEYFMKVDAAKDSTFTLDDKESTKTVETLEYNGVANSVVNITDKMATYHTTETGLGSMLGTGDLKFMESGVVYGFYLPLSYLKNNSQVTIYIKATTRIHTVSSQTGQESIETVDGYGVGELTVTKADLLDLD